MLIILENGITLVEIPYWWDRTVESLAVTIHKHGRELSQKPLLGSGSDAELMGEKLVEVQRGEKDVGLGHDERQQIMQVEDIVFFTQNLTYKSGGYRFQKLFLAFPTSVVQGYTRFHKRQKLLHRLKVRIPELFQHFFQEVEIRFEKHSPEYRQACSYRIHIFLWHSNRRGGEHIHPEL